VRAHAAAPRRRDGGRAALCGLQHAQGPGGALGAARAARSRGAARAGGAGSQAASPCKNLPPAGPPSSPPQATVLSAPAPHPPPVGPPQPARRPALPPRRRRLPSDREAAARRVPARQVGGLGRKRGRPAAGTEAKKLSWSRPLPGSTTSECSSAPPVRPPLSPCLARDPMTHVSDVMGQSETAKSPLARRTLQVAGEAPPTLWNECQALPPWGAPRCHAPASAAPLLRSCTGNPGNAAAAPPPAAPPSQTSSATCRQSTLSLPSACAPAPPAAPPTCRAPRAWAAATRRAATSPSRWARLPQAARVQGDGVAVHLRAHNPAFKHPVASKPHRPRPHLPACPARADPHPFTHQVHSKDNSGQGAPPKKTFADCEKERAQVGGLAAPAEPPPRAGGAPPYAQTLSGSSSRAPHTA
jgi:hypothetical protein